VETDLHETDKRDKFNMTFFYERTEDIYRICQYGYRIENICGPVKTYRPDDSTYNPELDAHLGQFGCGIADFRQMDKQCLSSEIIT
jgi:hypothetical protein